MRKLLWLTAAGLLLLGTACGGSGGSSNQPAANNDTPAEAPSNELEFVGTEFAFAGPETAPEGELTITFTNNGEQPHVMVGYPFEEGAPPLQELAKLSEKAAKKYATGPLAGAGLKEPLKPGQSETFTVDTTGAGTFGFICFVTDPKTKKPHMQLGMMGSITIES